jgi:hypothetical protein
VSGDLVPPGVRQLALPLSATTRAPGIAHPAIGGGLAGLVERVLDALETVPLVDKRELPDDVLVGWSFTAEWLAEAMPTMSAITRDALAERLREHFGNPPPALVDAIGRFWVRWLLESLLWALH